MYINALRYSYSYIFDNGKFKQKYGDEVWYGKKWIYCNCCGVYERFLFFFIQLVCCIKNVNPWLLHLMLNNGCVYVVRFHGYCIIFF